MFSGFFGLRLPRRIWNYYFKKKSYLKCVLHHIKIKISYCFICNPEKNHLNEIQEQYKVTASFQNNELPSEIFLITLIIFHHNFKICEDFLLGLCRCCKFQLHESKPFSLQVFEKPFSRNHCFLKSRSFVDHRKTVEFQEPQRYFNIFSENYNLL